MGARFVRVDHDTQLLLPPDMRQWVPKDHLVHFIMDGVEVGILKEAMGFRRFSLRGQIKANLEWTLVCLPTICAASTG